MLEKQVPEYDLNEFKLKYSLRDVNESVLIECLELAQADIVESLQSEIPPIENWTEIEKTRFFSALYAFAAAKYLPRQKVVQQFTADEEEQDLQTKVNRLLQVGSEELNKLSFYGKSHRKSVYLVEP